MAGFQTVAQFISALQGADSNTSSILGAGQDQSDSDSSDIDSLIQQAAMAKAGAAAQTPGGGSNGAAPVGGVSTAPVKVSGNVDQWTRAALSKLGLDYNQYGAGVEQLIQHESGGNPNAINETDSNAKAGHPSQGLTQTIPGTFQEYALPGYNTNIDDPVSNIIAGVRYAKANYGLGMLAAGGRHDANGNYLGY